MLKYKFYFKKQLELDIDFLNEFIKFATTKDFTEFKGNALFYLKDMDSFLDIIYKNKEEIIKINNFEPIEVIKIEDIEKVNISKNINKLEDIIKFSNIKKVLLIYFNSDFWESMAKKCSKAIRKNIELCFNIRKKLLEYKKTITNLIMDEKNSIRKDISSFCKKGRFISLLDKIIKEYINQNPNISNLEIIELIKKFDLYYSDERHITKREPDILKKSI